MTGNKASFSCILDQLEWYVAIGIQLFKSFDFRGRQNRHVHNAWQERPEFGVNLSLISSTLEPVHT